MILRLRRFPDNVSRTRLPLFSAILLALTAAACTRGAQEVLPISRAIVGASRVEAVEIVLQPSALASVASLDERARSGGQGGAAALPFQRLLETSVRDAAVRAGLTAGRPLRLVLDIDQLDVQGTGAALFGRADRLAGTVYVRDAATRALLGQLYVDVGGAQAGSIGLALRGSGVRERLAASFAEQVADALSGKRPPR